MNQKKLVMTLFSFALCVCGFPNIFAEQESLINWRSMHFNSIDYNRLGIDGGAALYTLPSKDTLKFRVQFIFANGLFSFQESDATALNALSDMLILGGFGGKSFAQIQQELTQNGIDLSTSVNELGEIVVNCEALAEDFSSVLKLMQNLILKPMFNPDALTLWKQQSNSQFASFGNANTLGKQMQFINIESARLAFGPEHYLARAFVRASPKYIDAVTINEIQDLYQKILNRSALNVQLTGAYPASGEADVKNLVSKIPVKTTPIIEWLPSRLANVQNNKNIKSALIQKNDMTQSTVTLRFYYSAIGELNSIEKTQIAILSDIFSATGGVVGNDRFSNAMRAKSGLSYAPHAAFKANVIDPNTNVSAFVMNFQSPNEKIFEAVTLAKKTWDDFIKNGISIDELDKTKRALMNRLLATELTVFDKADLVFSKIIHGDVPNVNPIQASLESLEAQKNVDQMNLLLKRKLANNALGVLVIMGNPPDDQMKKLKSLSGFDFVEYTTVNSLL